MTMGNRNSSLKKALEARGISQEKLAKRLGISSQAVNERLNKDQDVDSLTFIDAVAELTGYSREQLISPSYQVKNEEPGPVVNEPQTSDQEEIYRNIVEGHTEYILIPRAVLKEHYRLVAVEQIEKERAQIEKDREQSASQAIKDKAFLDALLETNKTLIRKLDSLMPEPPHVKKSK